MADTIFSGSSDITVDTSGLARDLRTAAQNRLLRQFAQTEVLNCLLDAFVAEAQVLFDAATALADGYQIARAAGLALDHIGERVGQSRVDLASERKAFLRGDAGATYGVDRAPMWVRGAPRIGTVRADDFRYRQLIIAKIFSNHVRAAGVPELTAWLRMLTGRIVSARRTGTVEVEFVVSAETTVNVILLAIAVTDGRLFDRAYVAPIGSTTSIRRVLWRPSTPVISDRGRLHSVDSGRMGVAFSADRLRAVL